MSTEEWPSEFIDAINRAVNKAISHPLRNIISEIDEIGIRFSHHEFFSDSPQLLSTSILRNKMLAATLSRDVVVSEVLNELLREIRRSGLFEEGEVAFLEKASQGKKRQL